MRVVARSGLAGLTHRAVADEAGVPLGSTTYYFADRNDLLLASMQVAIKTERRLIGRHLESKEGTLPQQLAALLAAQTATRQTRDRVRAAYELYVVAARSDLLRPVSAQWDAVLREAIARRCSEQMARDLYAVVSGLALEAAVADKRVEADYAARLLERIAAGARRD
jgi:TetR/AcrR family transcriptional regulator, regulator of biofilm formation and stress response